MGESRILLLLSSILLRERKICCPFVILLHTMQLFTFESWYMGWDHKLESSLSLVSEFVCLIEDRHEQACDTKLISRVRRLDHLKSVGCKAVHKESTHNVTLYSGHAGLQIDWIILKVSSNLDSVILWMSSMHPAQNVALHPSGRGHLAKDTHILEFILADKKKKKIQTTNWKDQGAWLSFLRVRNAHNMT